jgi:superfamily II DNA/RNA helicase
MYRSNTSSTQSSGKNFGADRGFQRNSRPAVRPSSRFGGSGRSNGGNFGGNQRRQRPNRGERIDINRFIQKAQPESNIEIKNPIVNSFDDFKFCDQINRNLKKKNYITPTPIQDQTINYILEGRDIIGLAQTGTGKTGAFLLPLIEKISKDRSIKVLIVAPTRELALQIDQEFRQFSWDMKIFSAVCVGGMPAYNQIGNLRRNPNFVIGTPGRLKDFGDRGLIKFEQFNKVVLDEVDRMLDMGFVDEIKTMLSKLPKERQSLFFSATLPIKIRDFIGQFLFSPVKVEIQSGETAKNVEQDVVRVRDRAFKFNQLQEILSEPELKKVLIFSETKMDVEKLTVSLIREGFKAESIHGDKRQSQRHRALTAFKTNHINILVATDVAARGLDIKDITHVINYTVPQTYDDYIHRIGRTGRGSSKGKALTFVEA